MLLGSVVKSGGERRKRSWNKKRSVEGMFPKAYRPSQSTTPASILLVDNRILTISAFCSFVAPMPLHMQLIDLELLIEGAPAEEDT
jgi:hypothetical protein